jgi:5-(carboxyamino)imidazole ribonucleotide synthase
MTRVGVIGGGQLAWMMAKEAPKLGIELIVQTPNPYDSAVSLSEQVILAPIADAQGTTQLASLCDVITFENEFVDLIALQKLATQGVLFRPSLSSLEPLLDKYQQRCFCQKIGLPVPQFEAYNSLADLRKYGFPLVLKARRHGYDGQGTVIINSQTELEEALTQFQQTPLLIEEFVPFAQELAVIAARGVDGELRIYPVTETHQQQQVCRWVIVPAKLDDSQIEQVEAIATKLLTELNYVGVLGIELFLTPGGKILVNETAPRTHNSGHYTLDACITSQFALQLQAVTEQKLGDISLKSQGALMVNLLGLEDCNQDYQAKLAKISQIEGAFVHWYQKKEFRQGRKLGHVTVLFNEEQNANNSQIATSIAQQIESIWYASDFSHISQSGQS